MELKDKVNQIILIYEQYLYDFNHEAFIQYEYDRPASYSNEVANTVPQLRLSNSSHSQKNIEALVKSMANNLLDVTERGHEEVDEVLMGDDGVLNLNKHTCEALFVFPRPESWQEKEPFSMWKALSRPDWDINSFFNGYFWEGYLSPEKWSTVESSSSFEEFVQKLNKAADFWLPMGGLISRKA